MDPYGAYAQQAASTASPAQLVAMLYDGALARVEGARVALSSDAPDLGAANIALSKAQAIVAELTATLDHERGGAVAASLASLYAYCSAQLVAANIGKQARPLDEVTAVLTQLRDAWAEACLPAAAAVAG